MSTLALDRHDTYPAIDPNLPAHSLAGKTIVISGAGSGIGRNTALEIAKAGSGTIHLLGRRLNALEETKTIIEKEAAGTKVVVQGADVTDETSLKKVATAVGKWDLFVMNAGILPAFNLLKDAKLKDWWIGHEVSVGMQFVYSYSADY
jgi:NADP-dependent 3-hydroxy acid dehydrogenase YdfG